jgi:hypothetical protein
MVWANGDKYTGGWKRNKRHGTGTMVWANGDKYEGEWYRDGKNGKGTMVYANGGKYEGNWKDGKRHGKGTKERYRPYDWKAGTMVYANGDKYEGEWENDKRHGKGTMMCAAGGKHTGGWYCDERIMTMVERGDSGITFTYRGPISKCKKCGAPGGVGFNLTQQGYCRSGWGCK